MTTAPFSWRLVSMMAAAALSLLATTAVLAAEPTPTPIGGDPRSAGEGPGLVGDPLLAIGGVVLVAVVAIVATTVWVRLTARPDEARSRRS